MALGLGLWFVLGARREGAARVGEGARPAAKEADELAITAAAPGTAPAAGERRALETSETEAEQIRRAGPGATPQPPSPWNSGHPSYNGLVLDALTGEPIANADAWVPKTGKELNADELDHAERYVGSRSDGEGRFELPRAEWASFGVVYVQAEGFGLALAEYVDGHATHASAQRFELLPPAELELRALDPAGNPLPAVRFELECAGGNWFSAANPHLRWTRVADGDGRARFADLPAELLLEWSVRDRGGLEPLVGRIALAPGERRHLEVRIGLRAELVGRVFDAQGGSVAGLSLWLARKTGPTRLEEGVPLVAEARSNTLGRFTFKDLLPGSYALGPAPGGSEFVPRGEAVVVDREWLQQDLVVTRGLAIEGRVLGAVADEYIFVQADSLEGHGTTNVRAKTDGTFRLFPLAPGNYRVRANNGQGAAESVQAPAGTSGLELILQEPRTLTIRLTGTEGASIFSDFGLDGGSGGTREQTAPVFDWPIGTGAHAFVVTSAGDRVGFVPAFTLGAGEAADELTIALRPGARVTCVHRATQGQRVVRLFVDGAAFPLASREGAGLWPGAALTALVPAGELRAELLEGERVVASEKVTLLPGEHRRIVLEPR